MSTFANVLDFITHRPNSPLLDREHVKFETIYEVRAKY